MIASFLGSFVDELEKCLDSEVAKIYILDCVLFGGIRK